MISPPVSCFLRYAPYPVRVSPLLLVYKQLKFCLSLSELSLKKQCLLVEKCVVQGCSHAITQFRIFKIISLIYFLEYLVRDNGNKKVSFQLYLSRNHRDIFYNIFFFYLLQVNQIGLCCDYWLERQRFITHITSP